MKNTIVFCVLIVITGLLIAIGPQYIFRGCPSGCCSGNTICFWSIKLMLAVGMIVTALGAFCFVYNDPKIQLGMTIPIFLTGIVSLLALHVIIGGCAVKSMNCNIIVIPILTALNIIAVIISGIRILFLKKITK
ncbi:MAG: DUF4418 family protein [Treponema sp.]|nr:DUF4418 family protein [Treponema sp.]